MDIEASKDGLKLSYKRFLADSAPGYLAILLIALASAGPSSRLPSIFRPAFEAASHLANQHEHIRDFALLVGFLLGPPLGLLLNATSFVLLRGAHDVMTALFLQRRLRNGLSLVKAINRFEEAVEQLDAGRFSSLEHVHGVQMMSRTVALVAALAACCLGWPGALVVLAFLLALVLRVMPAEPVIDNKSKGARRLVSWLKNAPEHICTLVFSGLTLFLLSAGNEWPFQCAASGSAQFGLAALGFVVLSSYLRAHALNRVLDIAEWIHNPNGDAGKDCSQRDRPLARNLEDLRSKIGGVSAKELLLMLSRQATADGKPPLG
jgi:hypothetical protein